MSKTYTKEWLYAKSTTLKMLQQAAADLGAQYETDANKESVAKAILLKQQEIALTTPVPGEAGEGIPEHLKESVGLDVSKGATEGVHVGANGSGEPVDAQGNVVDPAVVGSVAAQNEAAKSAELPTSEAQAQVDAMPEEFIAAFKKRLGLDLLATRVDNVEQESKDRTREVERRTVTLEKWQRTMSTTHGSIDNLGTIDDLNKK